MRSSLVDLYVHFVWATWDRLPLLTEPLRASVYACLQAECTTMKAEVIALGGIEDHVHLLVRFPSTVSLADFVKQVKGSSSHMANQWLGTSPVLKWQGSYAAFGAVEPLDGLRDYIRDQEEHHRRRTFRPDWELPS